MYSLFSLFRLILPFEVTEESEKAKKVDFANQLRAKYQGHAEAARGAG